MKLIPRLVAGAVLLVSPVHAQENVESSIARFQLFNECKPMRLTVEGLPDDAGKIRLTQEQVRTAVESRLRSARLYDAAELPYLYVNVNVFGPAFGVRVEYNKYFLDTASGEFGMATTWNTGGTGTHGGDAGFILSAVSQHLDKFLVEYLRVNEENCGR